MEFNCDRTCPLAGERWCRFRPILDAMGPTRVDSETVKVRVELTDTAALRRAVEAIGGSWIGEATHKLYAGPCHGVGFKLPGWHYPCVLANGELAYDNYNGRWGDSAQLDKLKAEYTISLAESRCQELGWQCERAADGSLTVYHRGGGKLTVTVDGTVDACGFVGSGCHEAIKQLDLGQLADVKAKPAFGQIQAEIQQPE